MNVDTLLAAMPGLARARAGELLPFNDAAMREYQITNANRAWMWLAQTGHESLSLRYLEEIADGSAYEGRKDLGNTQPGDGKKYKGRGPIQITGRYNYTAAASALNLPLVDQPQMAAQPNVAFRISAWWWFANGLNAISDTGDVTAATRKINGGLNGLSDRQSRHARCKALGPSAVLPGQPKHEEEDMAKGLVLYNADGRVEYHSLDSNGDPWQKYMGQDGKWSGWRKFGRGGANPFVEIDGARHPDGRLEVFARTAGQVTYTNWQSGPNGAWQANYRQL